MASKSERYSLIERLQLASESAAAELAKIRELEQQQLLTAKQFVRKGMLLLLEENPEGELSDVEEAYRRAFEVDPECIDAYVELGHYHYGVLDNAVRGRDFFLRAADFLRKLNSEVLEGLVECAEELEPERDSAAVREQYAAMLVSKETGQPQFPTGVPDKKRR